MNKGRKPAEHYLSCPYNVAVECADLDNDCSRCGWFPHCHAHRVKALRLLAQYGLLRKKVELNV